MKKFITITMGALVAFTVAATSITAPAHAGKREQRIVTGIILGAIGGAIIAGDIHRKKRRRAHRARHYYNDGGYYNRSHQGRRHKRGHGRRDYSRDYSERYFDHSRSRNRTRRYYDDTPQVVYEEPRYQRPVYVAPRVSSHKRHVKRCYAAYRTYDHRSDTFIGYDGNEHKCRK
ncbi:MAG: BA14K family protein [Rhizobiaceae bacterium]